MAARTYMDHNATAPTLPEVVDAMLPWLRDRHGNASSVHLEGQRARAAVDRAREHVGALLDADPSDVVFTSGATAANNLAIRGLLAARTARHGATHVICTAVEHPSVRSTVQGLERAGTPVTWIPVDGEGALDEDAYAAALARPDGEGGTALVTAMVANNETGVVFPVPRLAAMAAARAVPLHADCVQAASTLRLGDAAAGATLRTVSAHKIGGPQGAGALAAPRDLGIRPLVTGGHQERGLFAGTENVAALVGFGEAARLAVLRRDAFRARVGALRDHLQAGVLAQVPAAQINGGAAPRLATTLNVSFDDTEGETVLVALDQAGVACSSGSACTAGSLEPSHVLLAMGLSRERARGAIRLSLGPSTSQADVDHVLSVLPKAVADVRSLAPYREAWI